MIAGFSFNFLSLLVSEFLALKVAHFLHSGGVLLVCRAHSLYDYPVLKSETTELIFANFFWLETHIFAFMATGNIPDLKS